MKYLFGLIFLVSKVYAQTTTEPTNYKFEFVKIKKITRSDKQDIIVPIYIKAQIMQSAFNSANNHIEVEAVSGKTTLLPSSYSLNFQQKKFNQLSTTDSSSNVGFLIIKKDSTTDRQRVLTFIMKRYVNNTLATDNRSSDTIQILVDGILTSDSLKTYNYLAYVGTNFDLVDGVQARNLFFATNFFVKPSTKKGNIGMFLSLYGNRTMTVTDSSGITRRISKIEPASDTTTRVITEQSTIVRNRVSDNLGAYISPLIKLCGASKSDNQLQLYYTPSLEFVWRRTEISTTYSNPIDQDTSIQSRPTNGIINYPNTSKIFRNNFAFNVGAISFMVVHETQNISIRVHCSVGYSSNFFPKASRGASVVDDIAYFTQGDIFFSGRAWVTEPYTGITLQAEITNTLFNPRPFYGVTLSKAIDFKSISTIFKPLTRKD